jgi:hypothetical protein
MSVLPGSTTTHLPRLERRTVVVRSKVEPSVAQELEALARRRDRSVSGMIRHLVREALEREARREVSA